MKNDCGGRILTLYLYGSVLDYHVHRRVEMGSWIVSQILVWCAIIGIILAPIPTPRPKRSRFTVIVITMRPDAVEDFTFSFNVLATAAHNAAGRANEAAKERGIGADDIMRVLVVPGWNKVVYAE